MKQYPSIPNSKKAPQEECFGFIKYDGSNLRFEYSKKKGWHKFGTRHATFDETSEHFGSAISIFQRKYADDLERVFRSQGFHRTDEFIVFCEWFGAKSFAGQHEDDDPKDIVLFDVNVHKKGILSPQQFLEYFGHLKVAECIYRGELNDHLIASVRTSNFDNIDFRSRFAIKQPIPEGIICKGGSGHKLWMCKIKTNEYFAEIKNRRPLDWEDFWE